MLVKLRFEEVGIFKFLDSNPLLCDQPPGFSAPIPIETTGAGASHSTSLGVAAVRTAVESGNSSKNWGYSPRMGISMGIS